MCTHTEFEVAYKTKHNNVELQIEEKKSQRKKEGRDGYSRPSADVVIVLEPQIWHRV